MSKEDTLWRVLKGVLQRDGLWPEEESDSQLDDEGLREVICGNAEDLTGRPLQVLLRVSSMLSKVSVVTNPSPPGGHVRTECHQLASQVPISDG